MGRPMHPNGVIFRSLTFNTALQEADVRARTQEYYASIGDWSLMYDYNIQMAIHWSNIVMVRQCPGKSIVPSTHLCDLIKLLIHPKASTDVLWQNSPWEAACGYRVTSQGYRYIVETYDLPLASMTEEELREQIGKYARKLSELQQRGKNDK